MGLLATQKRTGHTQRSSQELDLWSLPLPLSLSPTSPLKHPISQEHILPTKHTGVRLSPRQAKPGLLGGGAWPHLGWHRAEGGQQRPLGYLIGAHGANDAAQLLAVLGLQVDGLALVVPVGRGRGVGGNFPSACM